MTSPTRMIRELVRKLNENNSLTCDRCKQPMPVQWVESYEGPSVTVQNEWLCDRCMKRVQGMEV